MARQKAKDLKVDITKIPDADVIRATYPSYNFLYNHEPYSLRLHSVTDVVLWDLNKLIFLIVCVLLIVTVGYFRDQNQYYTPIIILGVTIVLNIIYSLTAGKKIRKLILAKGEHQIVKRKIATGIR